MHLRRLILLCDEFAELTPRDTTPEGWKATLGGLSELLTTSCRKVDPQCTGEMLELSEGN